MKYLMKRLTPLMNNVSDKGKADKVKVCCDKLIEEMGHQSETIAQTGRDMRYRGSLSKADVGYVEAFTRVYDSLCNPAIVAEKGKTKEFNAVAKEFQPRFDRYVYSLKRKLGDVKYALLSRKVEENIKKPSAEGSDSLSEGRLSPSYSAALRAD